jgi:hypothetical protein
MHSFRLFVSAGLAAMLAIAPSFGQTPARVRGAITAIDDSNITVKEWDGSIFTLKTGPYTAYAYPGDHASLVTVGKGVTPPM